MSNNPQQRLQDSMEDMMENLDKNYLRKLTKKVYLCMAACQDQPLLSSQEVQHCGQTCSLPSREIEQLVNTEIQHFQNRLQRGFAACQDDIRDLQRSIPDIHTNKAKQQELQKKLDICIGKCADSHIPKLKSIEDTLIPQIKKRL